LAKLTRALLTGQRADVVVYFPVNCGEAVETDNNPSVKVLLEGNDPIARQLVEGALIQAFAAASLPSTRSLSPSSSIRKGEEPKIRLLPSVATKRSYLPNERFVETRAPTAPTIELDVQDVFTVDKQKPKIAMYAAGIAVMFLLFSASGAGGSLLEDEEAGTLDRLLASRLTVSQLLAGKWIFITCLGCLQLTVMFIWAQFVFGVDLWGHLGGFLVMTLATSAATASFALLLATICRSRSQLNAVSIILVLSMSALGGSMVPRFVMSDGLKQWGRVTFNAWALDGYQKVFWYESPIRDLSSEVSVLLAMAISLACIARFFGGRWEAS